MFPKSSLLLGIYALLLSPIASAFVLPDEKPAEGLYKTYYNAAGVQVTELVTAYTNETIEQLNKRGMNELVVRESIDSSKFDCGCGFNMDHQNCDYAVQGLKNYLDGTGGDRVGAGVSYWTYVTNVVAFICNGGPEPVGYGSGDLTIAYAEITDTCGWYVAGTEVYYIDTGAPIIVGDSHVDVGYMIWFSGLNFCNAAEGSKSHSC